MITLEEYLELKEDYVGVCIECGNQQESVEPDGRNVPCDECGRPTVFGVEELLQMGLVT
jgi:DNA-directed RNA polymerase subunit RPC12/RpoP